MSVSQSEGDRKKERKQNWMKTFLHFHFNVIP